MKFSKSLFWDTAPEQLDRERHARFIIERVFTRGTMQDFEALKEYYPRAKICHELKRSRNLDPITLNFCSVIYQIDKSDFRCYTKKPLTKEL